MKKRYIKPKIEEADSIPELKIEPSTEQIEQLFNLSEAIFSFTITIDENKPLMLPVIWQRGSDVVQ